MIDDQIELARQQRLIKRKRRSIVVIFGTMILVTTITVVWMLEFRSSAYESSLPPPPGESDFNRPPAENSVVQQGSGAQKKGTASEVTITSDELTVTADEVIVALDELKVLYDEALLYDSLKNDVPLRERIEKARAKAAFEMSNQRNLTALTSVRNMASELRLRLDEELMKFEDLLAKIAEAWISKSSSVGTALILAANEIDPENAKLRAYDRLFSDWPKVELELREADRFNSENKPAAELSALERVKALENDVGDLDERINRLRAKIQREKIRSMIRLADEAIADKRWPAAKIQIEKISALNSKRPELVSLRERLDSGMRNERVENAFREAQDLAGSDQWLDAEQLLATREAEANGRADYLELLKKARSINQVAEKLRSVIAAPSVLILERNKTAALKDVESANAFVANSSGLASLAKEVNELVEVYSKKYPINLLSDGETFIIVKHVGKVGITSERTVDLLPGDYVFEGSKEGYRSKRVEVTLRPDQPVPLITVIADEQI